jgi:hypothetical protein
MDDTLTDEEEQRILSLRAKLQDLIDSNPMAADHADDWTLLRFIQARQNDLAAAEAMFRGTMAWRNEININKLWAEHREAKTPEATIGDRHFYGGLFGVSGSVNGGRRLPDEERFDQVHLLLR